MTYVDSTSAVANTASLSVTIPAAASVGQVAWIYWAMVDTVTPTDPAGWTLADSGTNGNLQYRRLFKVLASGEPGSTVSLVVSVANKMSAVVAVDSDAQSPYEGTETPAEVSVNASGTNRTNPATTIPGARTVYSAVLSRGNTTLTSWTAPAGWTRVQQAFNTGSGETSIALAYRVAAAGSVGGDDWVSNVADLRGTTMLVVAEPTPSGGPTETEVILTRIGVGGIESSSKDATLILVGGSEASKKLLVVD